MQKWIAFFAVVTLAALSGTQTLGAETSSGEVEKVDAPKQTVIVSTECECGSGRIIEMTFTLNQKTQVLLDGKAAKIADLKKGDRVEIDYEETDQVTRISARRDG